MISPLILQAQIVPPVGGGSFGLADTTQLENPFQSPMWLDEIRFRLDNAPVDSFWSLPGWDRIRVELKLGNINLTNGFVPISLLGKILNDSNGEGVIDNGTRVENAPFVFTWKLPKPLFIPARELLRPTMYFETFPGAVARSVTIIYACRPLPKGTPTPTKLQIPWVSYYQPPDILISPLSPAVDATDQSTPANICNPWDEELHVQRFVGRLMGRARAHGFTSGFEEMGYMTLASAKTNYQNGKVQIGTLVSAQDSFNNILIRDQTPFSHVFSFVDRSWTVNCVLPPKGFYLFTVDRLWTGYEPRDWEAFTATVGISMIGWREVTKQRYDPRDAIARVDKGVTRR